MSDTAESSLGMTFSELQERIAEFQGSPFPIETADESKIEGIIDSGLRSFYFPQASENIPPGFKWSFLSILKTSETVTGGSSTFALPDDFGGGLTHLNITGTDLPAIELVEQVHFERQKVGGATTNGDPKTATVFVSAAAGNTESERYSVEWFPTSLTDVTVSYYYDLIPDTIGSATAYPFGAQLHSELILASCLAVVEMRENEGQAGPFQAEFMKLLLSAITRDVSLGKNTGRKDIHPVVAPTLTTFASDYTHLRGEIGNILGYGYTTQMYSYNESQGIDRVIDRGLKRFYWPENPIDANEPVNWSFLRPTTSIVTVADTETQDLPINVGSIIGDFTYNSDTEYFPVKIVPVGMILKNRSGTSIQSGRPVMAATRVKGSDGTAEQIREVLWWPKPDAVFTFLYQFNIRPDKMAVATPFSLAGPEHAETILESCLAIAHEIVNPGEGGGGDHETRYLKLLAASILRDKEIATAEFFGSGHSGHGHGHHGGHGHGGWFPFRADGVTFEGIQY